MYQPRPERLGTLDFIRNRFPRRSEILTVLGAAVFVCHSWAVLGFLNRLSAFLLYFRVSEIAEVFAFMMAWAFLESLLVTGLLTFLGAILPSRLLRDGFAYKGFIFITVATAAAILFQRNLRSALPAQDTLTLYWLVPLVLAATLIFATQMMPRARDIVLNLADRVSIMLFFYVPIGLLSLMVVMLGTLF